VRGPACAARLANRAAAVANAKKEETPAQQPPVRISILRGGFDSWYEEIGPRDQFTEEPEK
jgi:hypothetical protein